MRSTNPFKDAIEREHAAWNAVKDHLPGTLGHEPILWATWLAAAQAVVIEEKRRKTLAGVPDAKAPNGRWASILLAAGPK